MEKPWYKSKKFWAFVITEVLLFALAMTALFKQPDLGWPLAAFMLAIVITMGAVAFGFNLSMAKLDMYVRGMAMQPGLNIKPPAVPITRNTMDEYLEYLDDDIIDEAYGDNDDEIGGK